MFLRLVSEFTLKLTSQRLSAGRTKQKQRIAQQLSMARLSARLGYHVDKTSQSNTQTGRALIIRLLLKWKSVHAERCSFTKLTPFPYRQHILTDNNLRSVSLTPPLFFQPRLDGDGMHRNGGCAAGCLSQSGVGESKGEKRAGLPAIRPVFSLNTHFIMALMGFILASGHTSLVQR